MSFASMLIKGLQRSGKMVLVRSMAPIAPRVDEACGSYHAQFTAAKKAALINVIVYGLSQLSEDAKETLQLIVVETRNAQKQDFVKVYYIASSLPTSETRGDNERWQQSLFVLATMSRIPGISGRYTDFYFHPPSVLGKSRVTSQIARTQALTSLAESELRGRLVEE